MCVPVIGFGQCLVNAVVEVFVVREDDMPANVVELEICQNRVSLQAEPMGKETYKAFRCDVCRGQSSRRFIRVDYHP